ncbi:MAG: endonuclease/exonuclease/phosphatase family protein, partial [Pseudomonadota bacterium]
MLPSFAETLRLATWHAELTRDGPGLLLRDIRSGDDPQIAAAIAVIGRTAPDVLLLTGFDHDPGGATLAAFAEALADAGAPYPHRFALPSNAGLPTDLDLDGDGRRGTARDGQGYGRFRGHGAMVLLSRLPIAEGDARDFSDLLWREAPWAEQPATDDGAAFPSMEADAVQRLSSTGHWVVPLALADGQALDVLAFAATPPVFDGPEDRNGLRNAGEIGLWQALLDGEIGPAPEPPFVILGRANLDPADGEGLRDAITALLDDPRLQ